MKAILSKPLARVLCSTLTLLLLSASPAAQAGGAAPRNIFAVSLSGVARFQKTKTVHTNCQTDPETGDKFCDDFELTLPGSVALNNKGLINLATGQPLGTIVPKSRILAVALPVGSGNTASLIVYDTLTSNTVAQLATIEISDVITGSKLVCATVDGTRECATQEVAFEGLGTLTWNAVGNSGVNSIDGGTLNLYLGGALADDGSTRRLTGAGAGTLDVTTTTTSAGQDPVTIASHLLIRSLAITSSRWLTVVP